MVLIRECKKEDFGEVFELLSQLWPNKKLEEENLRQVFQRGLNSEFQSYICAEIEGHIVGFASLTIKNNLWQVGFLGHIDELVVDTEYRSEGIGSKLLDYLVKLAKNKNCNRIELDSALEREAAHKFYKQNGFENRAFVFSKKI